jgi:signal transduction histidine kinase
VTAYFHRLWDRLSLVKRIAAATLVSLVMAFLVAAAILFPLSKQFILHQAEEIQRDKLQVITRAIAPSMVYGEDIDFMLDQLTSEQSETGFVAAWVIKPDDSVVFSGDPSFLYLSNQRSFHSRPNGFTLASESIESPTGQDDALSGFISEPITLGRLYLLSRSDVYFQMAYQQQLLLLSTGAVSIVVCLLLVIFLTRRTLQSLNSVLEHIDGGKEIQTPNTPLPSEVAAIATLWREKISADRINAIKSRYFAGVSHDLRQPLHVINLYSEMLTEMAHEHPTMPISEIENDIVSIRQQNHLLKEMIRSHLDLALIESKGIAFRPEDFTISDLISTVRTEFLFSAQTKGLNFHVRHRGSESDYMNNDPSIVHRILANLIGNAIKFTDKGDVWLIAERQDDYIRFDVRDTGPGLSESQRHIIFESFRQLEDDPSKKQAGYGLGLSICMDFCNLVGGHLDVTSKLGKGSCFTLLVPDLNFAPDAVTLEETNEAPPVI